MVAAIGLSQYNVALFHLVNHAFFKALLFLSAGQIIHSMMDEQDIRKLGGLIKFLPLTYSIMIIGSLSLLATPFLTGFYSKDLIIELAYAKYSISSTYSYYLLTITAGLTAFYSFRLIMLTFLTVPNSSRISYLNVHEAKLVVIISLLILSLFSIFFGYIFSDLFIGIGNNTFSSSLFIHPNHISLIEAEFSIPLIFKLMPAIFSLIGASLAIILYQNKPEFFVYLTDNSDGFNKSSVTTIGRKIYTFLNGKYFFDVIYNYYFTRKTLQFGFQVTNLLERGVIELIGPYGLSNTLFNSGKNISKLDTGIVTSYALYIVLGLMSLIFIIFAPLLLNFWYTGSDFNSVSDLTLSLAANAPQQNLNDSINTISLNGIVNSSLFTEEFNKFSEIVSLNDPMKLTFSDNVEFSIFNSLKDVSSMNSLLNYHPQNFYFYSNFGIRIIIVYISCFILYLFIQKK